jgi:hypothetical protein
LLVLACVPLSADDYVLPMFAVNMPSGDGTAWSTEVYVTNTGTTEATVTVGIFLPGRISDTPPCQTLIAPFVTVPPRSTVLWRTPDLSGGIGCPAFAAGGLTFNADRPVRISSRTVRHVLPDIVLPSPLSGIGQTIDAVDLLDSPKGEHRMILPAVGWHPNSCGPSKLDTNVFFTNPNSVAVKIELEAAPGEGALIVDGATVEAPYVFEVAPFSQRVIRLAGSGAPMLPVCLEPVISSFTITTSGSISAIASIIDRQSGDPRTSAAIPIE